MRRQHTRRLLTGITTYVPGVSRISERSTGGTDVAEYCYSTWLRHLMVASEEGLPTDPDVVAEIGPGDSLGTGTAALLTGARAYVGIDLVDYAGSARNVAMVDDLQALLSARTPVARPSFDLADVEGELGFPSLLISEDRLTTALAPNRVDAIRAALAEPGSEQRGGIVAGYSSGHGRTLALAGTADIVFSQAVLEHVDGLAELYSEVARALRPGGYASHVIDFKSHNFARDWNGHWTISDWGWKLVRGRRRWAINREPLSTHLRLIEESGLDIVASHRTFRPSTIERRDLAPRFREMSPDDLKTSSAMIQAVKPEH